MVQMAGSTTPSLQKSIVAARRLEASIESFVKRSLEKIELLKIESGNFVFITSPGSMFDSYLEIIE